LSEKSLSSFYISGVYYDIELELVAVLSVLAELETALSTI